MTTHDKELRRFSAALSGKGGWQRVVLASEHDRIVSELRAERFTVDERRTMLDLIDEEHARDRRNHERGRTTPEVFAEQTTKYTSMRRKLVALSPADA